MFFKKVARSSAAADAQVPRSLSFSSVVASYLLPDTFTLASSAICMRLQTPLSKAQLPFVGQA